MSNDPFTLDMFDNTALSSGFGLGVTAFGSFAPEAAPEPANDDDPDPTPPPPAPAPAKSAKAPTSKSAASRQSERANFYLDGNEDRGLAATWKERARLNVAAILSAREIERTDVPVTREHQKRLIRFTGFGASELTNGMFRRPGEVEFRKGWDELGSSLETAVCEADYASLARCTQYAHFTPEFIVRAIWAGLTRLGWRGGRVLEPGIGTGLFPALMPEAYRSSSYVTGVELDPVTTRIVKLLQPKARIIEGDFSRTDLTPIYDLAIGNPPFSDRTVRSDRAYPSTGRPPSSAGEAWAWAMMNVRASKPLAKAIVARREIQRHLGSLTRQITARATAGDDSESPEPSASPIRFTYLPSGARRAPNLRVLG